tara:strand:- start:1424 stop:2080 length:657 start_codon:yes stop_codon:yes gene_type:complete
MGNIIELLELKPSDRFADIGCGDGKLATHISQTVKFHQTPLGIEQDEICLSYDKNLLLPLMKNATDFLENTHEQFDKFLLKQIIHHIYRPHQNTILASIYRALNPKGSILILSMPDKLSYPVFDQAKKIYERNESDFNFEQLKEDLDSIGFSTYTQKCTYRTNFPKKKYLQAISECFISTLSIVSDEQMHQGLIELEKKLPKIVSVEDPLIALVATKI